MAKYISTEPLPVGVSEAEFQCERDGLTIRGTEYRRAGERLPIAVVSHGIRAWQATVRHYAVALAELGYVAYTFDFCGGCAPGKGKSDGDSTDMSVLTEVEDLLRVIACAKSRPYTDPSRVLLMGCSQGGFVSAITAARLGEEVEALILLYPALCIPDDLRAGRLLEGTFDPVNLPETIPCGSFLLGRRYVEDMAGADAFQLIRGFPGDVLLVHGDADRAVDLSYSQRACQLYRERSAGTGGPRTRLEVMVGGGHGFTEAESREVIRYMREFLA